MDLSRPGMPDKMDVTKSTFGIYIRPSFRHAPTKSENKRIVNVFCDDLMAFLDNLKAAMDKLAMREDLSQLGKTTANTELLNKCLPQLQNYAKRVMNLVEQYENAKAQVFRPQAFPTTGDKAADEVRAVEIRSLFRAMDTPKQIELYLNSKTTLEVIGAIETAPLPLLPADILTRGKQGQMLRSSSPDALEALSDHRETVECIRQAVLNAFLWAEAPIPPEPALREALDPLPE